MTNSFPPVYYQGSIKDCTANAIAGAFQYEMLKNEGRSFKPSVLFIYYNQRVAQNTVDFDSGASLRDGMYSIHNWGVCDEVLWPYRIPHVTKKPFETCYAAASMHKEISYYSPDQNIQQLKGCLAEGHPFVFGFSIFDSFKDTDRLITAPMPSKTENKIFGHAAVAVGYDDADKTFIVRNSWGNSWGDQGYFKMPYDYLLDKQLSSDFWTIRLTSDRAITGIVD
jgi:C1A family cysteine protease